SRGADHRRQETSGALVIDREADVGQISHGYIGDAQFDVASSAAAGFLVKRDAVGVDHPAVIAWFTARVDAVVDRDHAVGIGIDNDGCGAAGGNVMQYVGCVGDFAAAAVLVHRGLLTSQQHARLTQTNVFFQREQLSVAIVAATAGFNHGILLHDEQV